MTELDTAKFEEFISAYPIYEYRILDTSDLSAETRVRQICRQECERYGSTWACPPAVGTLEACEKRIRSYGKAVFFSSVAEVSDLMNMQEMLSTRDAHEELTTEVVGFLKEQGFDTFTLSESHGVVVSEIVEKEHMEYNLGGNTILWFSMVLYRTA